MRLFRRREPRAVRLYDLLSRNTEKAFAALAVTEARLGAASPEERTAYGVGVVETLQNLLSHPGAPVAPDDVRARLGPALARLWDEVDEHWLRVADWVAAEGGRGSGLAPEEVLGVTDRSLARLARGMHRTLPDGRFVGVADVARHALAVGEPFRAS